MHDLRGHDFFDVGVAPSAGEQNVYDCSRVQTVLGCKGNSFECEQALSPGHEVVDQLHGVASANIPSMEDVTADRAENRAHHVELLCTGTDHDGYRPSVRTLGPAAHG